ncbi:MAG: YadA C-terminal domain-containing protein [Phascolarctobacterium sp.]|nr:YadA C-terminal domain-containing protein [Phascolarctobacterium sp.]
MINLSSRKKSILTLALTLGLTIGTAWQTNCAFADDEVGEVTTGKYITAGESVATNLEALDAQVSKISQVDQNYYYKNSLDSQNAISSSAMANAIGDTSLIPTLNSFTFYSSQLAATPWAGEGGDDDLLDDGVDTVPGASINNVMGAIVGLDTTLGTVTDGNYVKADNTFGENINVLDKQIASNNSLIGNSGWALEELYCNNLQWLENIPSDMDGVGPSPFIDTITGTLINLDYAIGNQELYQTMHYANPDNEVNSVIKAIKVIDNVLYYTNETIGTISDGNYVKSNVSFGGNINALDTKLGTVSDGNYVKADNTFGQNINSLDSQVKTNTDAIEANTNAIDELKNRDNAITGNINKLSSEIDEVGALAAAMAGLHPYFEDGNKVALSAAVGTYDGKQALALGGFYAPNKRVMVSLGAGIVDGGSKMGNLGVSLALDRVNTPKASATTYTKAQVDELLAKQQAENDAKLAQKDAKIEAMLARIEALEAKK